MNALDLGTVPPSVSEYEELVKSKDVRMNP